MGEWITDAQDWRRAPDVHCELCGRLLPGRRWRVEVEGHILELCDSDCESVYRDFWLPERGQLGSAR
jgi:hypothetical protein